MHQLGVVETHVSKHNAALLVHLGLVVVINAKFGEKNLVFIRGVRPLGFRLELGPYRVCGNAHLQRLLSLGSIDPPQLDEGPEGCVVEVVDVA